ncbi:MAG: outer membrane beta-barrel protein, partial [Kiritimatiellia bacterium]|nr:outer membrane beta-barrel protein [Kiritimatiellia bacterium]
MKKNSMWIGGVAALLIASQSGWAQGGRLINVENKLRLRYDDNVHQVADNETSSFVVMDDVMINLDKVFEGGFVGLRYRTTFSVYDNRDDADTDWDHNVGLQASRAIGSRLTLAVRDDFSAIDSPQLVREDGTLAREDQSYLYNSFNASLLSVLTPKLNLDLSGRHAFLRYDKDLIANREDYDLVGAGATLRTLISKEMSVFGEVRYESQEYKGVGDIQTVTYYGYRGVAPVAVPDRGSDTISFGLGLNNQFSPNVIGAIRGGYTKKDFDAANTDSESAPYGEISLTVAPTSDTQLTLSGNYSLYQSSLMTYVNQTRSSAAANL